MMRGLLSTRARRVLGALHVPTHLFFATTLGGRQYNCPILQPRTVEVTCPHPTVGGGEAGFESDLPRFK